MCTMGRDGYSQLSCACCLWGLGLMYLDDVAERVVPVMSYCLWSKREPLIILHHAECPANEPAMCRRVSTSHAAWPNQWAHASAPKAQAEPGGRAGRYLDVATTLEMQRGLVIAHPPGGVDRVLLSTRSARICSFPMRKVEEDVEGVMWCFQRPRQ